MIPLLINEVLFVQNATGVGVNGGNLILKGIGFTVLFICGRHRESLVIRQRQVAQLMEFGFSLMLAPMIIYVLTLDDSLLSFGI